MDRISALSEILPYVREFLGKIFVIKIGGEIAGSDALDQIARQVSLIHHIGIKVVLVHGGGPQLDELAKQFGYKAEKIAGRRITDGQTLDLAKMVFAGKVATDVVAALRTHGAPGVGISGVDAGLILAKKRAPSQVVDDQGKTRTVDFGAVGDVVDLDLALIRSLFAEGIIPVVAPLAADEAGNVLNVNADTVASALAQKMGAEKLLIMTNVPGVLRSIAEPSSLISYLDIDAVQMMIEKGEIKGGMVPKAQACIQALQHGVPRTHIIDGGRRDSLLQELFLNEGVGTMIVAKRDR